jgi:hypothetical protein
MINSLAQLPFVVNDEGWGFATTARKLLHLSPTRLGSPTSSILKMSLYQYLECFRRSLSAGAFEAYVQ